MSNRTTEQTAGGSSLFLLFLVFLVLKLTGYIDWSWWWVTAPLWGPIAIFAVFSVVFFFIAFIVAVVKR